MAVVTLSTCICVLSCTVSFWYLLFISLRLLACSFSLSGSLIILSVVSSSFGFALALLVLLYPLSNEWILPVLIALAAVF